MANDHFVPRLYLKSFADSARPGKTFVYERGRPAPYKSSGIRSVASEADYYTLRKVATGPDKRSVDKLITVSETGAAPIIRKLLTHSSIGLSDEEYTTLITFVAILICRNPWFTRQLEFLEIEAVKNRLKRLAANKNEFYRIANERGIKETPENFEIARKGILDFENNVVIKAVGDESRDYYLLASLKMALELLPIIGAKHLVLLESDSLSVFVTSDNPAILLRPARHPSWSGVGFWDGHIFLPLSPNRSLMLSEEPQNRDIVQVNRDRVTNLNKEIMRYADKQVYSNLSSKVIAEEFNKTKPGERTPWRRIKIPLIET